MPLFVPVVRGRVSRSNTPQNAHKRLWLTPSHSYTANRSRQRDPL